MTTTLTSRIEGVMSSVAVKRPVKVASSTNVTTSGEQTIDGVSCVSGDRVLLYGQTSGVDNGIYVVSTSAWTRADDWNGAGDIVQGTDVRVTQGTSNSGRYRVTTADPITIGTTSVALAVIPESDVTSLDQLTGDSDDITQGSTNLYMTLDEKSKLAGIQALAEVNDDIVAGTNVTVTGGGGSDWTITAGAGATALGDLTDVTADATVDGGIYGLQYATAGGGSYDDALLTDTFYTESELGSGALDGRYYTESEADTLFAAASHTHTLSDITDAGTMAAQDASSVSITGGSATLSGAFSGTTISLTGAATISGSMAVTGTAPIQLFNESDAATDEKKWRQIISAGDYYLQALNDAESSSSTPMRIFRSGTTIDKIQLTGTTIEAVGNLDVSGSSNIKLRTVSVTDTTKTLSLTDENTVQECSNASAQLITIPTNSSVAFPTGTEIQYEQHGAGSLSLVGAAGVSINGVSAGTITLGEQYNGMRTRKIGSDSWIAYKWTLMTSVAPNPVVGSLDFESTSSQSLSMSSANFGWSDPDTWSIVVSLKRETVGVGQDIAGKYGASLNRAFYLRINSANKIYFATFDSGGSLLSSFTTTDTLSSTSTWYAIQIKYSKSSGAVNCFINGTEASYDARTNPSSGGNSVHIGSADFQWGFHSGGEGYYDGLMFSGAFFDGSIPSDTDIFNGSSGDIKNISTLTGLRSLLTGSTATDDHLLTDWTNNGAVTTMSAFPVSGPPSASLDFDGSTDYLSISNADWGTASHTKFSIIASVYIDSLAADRPIFQKGSYAAAGNREYRLIVRSDGAVEFFSASTGASGWVLRTATSVITTATWYAIQLDIDTAQASGSRGTLYINNSLTAWSTNIDQTDINSTTDPAYIGHDPNGSLYMDGLIYQPTFISGSNPATSDVFDGSAGKLKDLSALSGAYSVLDGSTATFDEILSSDWTNNGSVTTSATVP